MGPPELILEMCKPKKEPIPWVDPIPAKIRIQATPTPLLVVPVPEPDPAKIGFVTPLTPTHTSTYTTCTSQYILHLELPIVGWCTLKMYSSAFPAKSAVNRIEIQKVEHICITKKSPCPNPDPK